MKKRWLAILLTIVMFSSNLTPVWEALAQAEATAEAAASAPVVSDASADVSVSDTAAESPAAVVSSSDATVDAQPASVEESPAAESSAPASTPVISEPSSESSSSSDGADEGAQETVSANESSVSVTVSANASSVLASAPAETAASDSEPTDVPAATEEPASETTEAPAPTEEPASETTEAPAVTEEPASESTEVPAATEEPASESTEVPAATEEPASESTEASDATEEPASEATEVPTATEEPASDPTEVPAETAQPDASKDPDVTPSVSPEVTPSVEPSASPEVSEEPAVTPEAEKLNVSLSVSPSYLMAGEGSIQANASISGGLGDYSVSLALYSPYHLAAEKTVTLSEAGSVSVSGDAVYGGVHTAILFVQDASGQTAEASATMTVSEGMPESPADWAKSVAGAELTGDWHSDLLAIARTQLGYREYEGCFILDANGNRQLYTRYGHWYGSPYQAWCAMFVAFCLNYAEIPASQYPISAGCTTWRNLLQDIDAYEVNLLRGAEPGTAIEGAYQPVSGDLVFFNRDGEDDPCHIGIVEQVAGGKLHTIEGNACNSVCRMEYDLTDDTIVGYGITATVAALAGKETGAETVVTPMEEGVIGFTTLDKVNLRNHADVNSTQLAQIADAGTAVSVLTSGTYAGTLWYQVDYDGITGYIRGDLLTIEAPEATIEPEQSTYHCGAEEHTHSEACADAEGSIVCEITEHTHSDDCLVEPEVSPEVTPEVTAAPTYYCGVEEHTHSEACADAEGIIVCEITEHAHSDDCLVEPEVSPAVTPEVTAAPTYYCGVEEHTHGEACADAEGSIVCEITEHTHSDDCLVEPEVSPEITPEATAAPTYYCGAEEHTHGEACADAEGIIVCEITEHTHNDDCLVEPEGSPEITPEATAAPTYYCGVEEHTHAETCSDAAGALTCARTEHTHDDSCLIAPEATVEPVYYCGFEPHTHAETCSTADGALTCTLPEHTHDDSCLLPPALELLLTADARSAFAQETTVTLTAQVTGGVPPYALTFTSHAPQATQDPAAQTAPASAQLAASGEAAAFTYQPATAGTHTLAVTVVDAAGTQTQSVLSLPAAARTQHETEADFLAAIAAAQLTGDLRADIVAIAGTQLGYAESATDFVVDEAGQQQGYTRFGAWAQAPYTPWSAPFVQFSLHYAGLTQTPAADVPALAHQFRAAAQYHAADAYVPLAGDVVFFDWEEDGVADHVGVIAQATGDSDAYTITTIEGDVDGVAITRSFVIQSSPSIMGYGQVAENAVMDAIGKLITDLGNLPTADEVEAKLNAFYEADDTAGEEAYLTELIDVCVELYWDYQLMDEEWQPYVVNLYKLMDLEWMWSRSLLIEDITWKAPTAISSASTADFIELNLYDYNGNINTNYNSDNDWPGFQWNGGAYHKSGATYNRRAIDFIDFGNSMITDRDYAGSGNGKATTAWNIGNQGGNINAIVEYPDNDYANKPVGMSTGTEVLGRTLTTAGYPWVTNAGSMVDYFSNSNFATKKNTSSIDGLFQKNEVTGEYYYNSRWNHAQYSNNKFTLYNNIITPNFITYPFGNFLPFNDITSKSVATNVGQIGSGLMGDYVQEVINDLVADTVDATEQQLIDMLAEYRSDLQSVSTSGGTAWTTWSAKNAIYDYIGNGPTDDTGPITDTLLNKMYNIDWDVDTNFFFGMEMKMNFMQPKDGYTGNDTNQDGESDYPMVFYFTGDDDVWVYVDGVLFLDLSGIHRHVGGKIDFVNGKVHYYELSPATGDVSSSPYKTYTFAQLLSAAGKDTSILNSNGTFKDYSTHSFNFYYMERGSGSSVCRLNFNFPLLRQNTISVSKVLSSDVEVLGDPDFKFQVLKANSDGTKTNDLFIAAGTSYTIYDENNNVVGTGTTDADGVFTLKANQRAEFTGIKESSGKYYVRELLDSEFYEQYGEVIVDGSTITTANGSNVTISSGTFKGVESPVKDASDGATAFRFNNDVSESKLGNLSIQKVVENYEESIARAVTKYEMEVMLDGELLPVGTEYTVTPATGEAYTATVQTAGIVLVGAGEKVTISHILAGTKYSVQESVESSKGYVVKYKVNGVDVTEVPVTGPVGAGADISMIVTNGEEGTSIDIPVTKNLVAWDGKNQLYTFVLTQVADKDGTAMSGITVEKDVTFSADDASHSAGDAASAEKLFTLTYAAVDLAFDSSNQAKFYYKITEYDYSLGTNGRDYALDKYTRYDQSAYIVEVTITQDTATGEIAAALTGLWKDGAAISDLTTAISFTNTILRDLTLTKTVTGLETTDAPAFQFDVTVKDASGAPVTGTYGDVTLDAAGSAAVSVNHGETLTIPGLPYGAQWTIRETTAAGYYVSWQVSNQQTSTELFGIEVNGTLTSADAAVAVVCHNTPGQILPETGAAGTLPYTVGGLLLIAMASCLLYSQSKRRREGSTA